MGRLRRNDVTFGRNHIREQPVDVETESYIEGVSAACRIRAGGRAWHMAWYGDGIGPGSITRVSTAAVASWLAEAMIRIGPVGYASINGGTSA